MARRNDSDLVPPDQLLAVCDVLALKALEQLGKWIIRHDRSRPKLWRGRPLHEAHTEWRPDSMMITKSLRGAWDLVPVVLSRWEPGTVPSDEVLMNALDIYVHGLARSGHPHTLPDLWMTLRDLYDQDLPLFTTSVSVEKAIL